jgi:phage tail sheath protein FI
MALPASPSVVVLENDVSLYPPNVDSSVVGIVGFADKGPVNEPVLITNQTQLIETFGKPSTDIPGQGLEGALEILEATNRVYFVRALNESLDGEATVKATLGFCPGIKIVSGTSFDGSTVKYSVTSNDGDSYSGSLNLASGTNITSLEDAFLAQFATTQLGDQKVFAVEDSAGNVFVVSRFAGANSKLAISWPSAATTFALSAINASGSDANTAPTTEGSFNVLTASGGTYSLTANAAAGYGLFTVFNSKYPGTGYNLTVDSDGVVQGVSVEVDSKSLRDQITVNNNGATKETFLVELDPDSNNFLATVLTSDPLNNQSEYVYSFIARADAATTALDVAELPDVFADKLDSFSGSVTFAGATVTSATPRFIKMIEGTYDLTGGQSGYSTTSVNSESYVGSLSDQTAIIGNSAEKKGIYALDDDGLGISIALIPGITSQRVQNELITLAETSKNFVAVVAPPYGLDSVQDATDWVNGRSTSRTAGINNSYAAAYWPWVQVFNFFAGADQWYDPAIFAARQMVFTDSISDPWFAPAGFTRGRLTKPVNTETVLSQGDKDSLYSNNINPITREPGTGIVIFGQKTTQRNPTALDRVNVRRLMIYIRKILLQLGKPFQFEPNDAITWASVEAVINPFLSDLKSRRAIVEYSVKCDSSTNTPTRVDRNEIWCSIQIKPTKAAETVVFEVNLTSQSASING